MNPKYKDLPLSEELSSREQLLLIRLIEECAEVQQCATKMLRFGPSNYHPADPHKETNLHAFRRELDDLWETLREMGERPRS